MNADRVLLAGCGILREEVSFLIRKNGWPVETLFFDSALHCDLERLGRGLRGLLARRANDPMVVFYGACHPLMDDMLRGAHTSRTEGQNCVEMLLGHDRFTQELAGGAYFLLEEWARRWPEIMRKTFGPNVGVAREIFRAQCAFLLGIRTPCSGDFTALAEYAAAQMGLPLRWMDVTLDELERVLAEALARRTAGLSGHEVLP